jgi:formyl-CoA transferase
VSTAKTKSHDRRPPPLQGIRVIDLTQVYNGPYATYMMARNGAEVIKIEPPGGEHLRKRAGGSALPFAMLNGNKRSMVLDLKTPEAVAAVLRLVESADVLVENFTPGVMGRLGMGWDVLRARNPRLIYACSSGYGIDGPYRDYPAMDLSVQAMSGIMSNTGFADGPPVKAGNTACDFIAGTHVYAGVMTALFERERSGLGQMVEIAMLEAAYFTLTSNLGALFREGGEGREIGRTGNRHGGMSICPYNVYPAADGFIAILCSNDKHFAALMKALELPELGDNPHYALNKNRVAHMDAIDAVIGARTAQLSKEELFARIMTAKVPSAPVRTLTEVVNDRHLHARGALRWLEHPEHGRLVIAETPLRLHGNERPAYLPSVPLGQDTQAILDGLAQR